MQRKAYATGAALVAVLAVGSVGCTGGSGSGAAAADSKPGTVGTAAATAPPGTYRDLPEPCGAVETDILRAMLPGAESASAQEEGRDGVPAAYEGEQTVTYDNDRRVGCRWKSSTGLGSRHLLVDFERVVSYDPAVSDDERAVRLYEDMVLEAGIPVSPPSREGSRDAEGTAGDGAEDAAEGGGEAERAGSAGGSEEPGGSAGTGKPRETGEPSEGGGEGAGGTGEPDDVATPQSTPGAELAPRPLEGIGDAAYLDDELVTADSGVHRDVTLVFRTGNVIVTVVYEQWVTDKRRLPDSAELQEKARKLADQLDGEFGD
ncbi:hypothetical protein [Streptomyces sp. DH37]|uniref:hypothetical protein n=1 Tax=Streptomyces sp. DH37 TaxID=3040122 RepID=UPI002441BC24|nr:hypothetical protein [Streptomyces sp. DH37]MDG9705962.1 hypothetical protein [Streptomyces sp. DH37]